MGQLIEGNAFYDIASLKLNFMSSQDCLFQCSVFTTPNSNEMQHERFYMLQNINLKFVQMKLFDEINVYGYKCNKRLRNNWSETRRKYF